MDFKTTSTKRNRIAGFTLSEFLISMGIGGLVLAVVTSLTFYSARSFAAMANYQDLDSDSRNALDRITAEIRSCTRLHDALTNSTKPTLIFVDGEGQTLRLIYDPRARTVSRQRGTTSAPQEILLTECDRFQFSLFSRNPVAGRYDQFPASSPATTKLVQVSWTCSRKILGKRENTESVQTAKIVMRRQQPLPKKA